MLLDKLLDGEGKSPVRAALCGVGEFGYTLLDQCRYIQQIGIVALCDLDVERVRTTLAVLGYDAGSIAVVDSLKAARTALEAGRTVITEDASLLHQLDLDIFIEATGEPERGAENGRKAGCTTGTASKWRVRYAERRLAGLDETGNRGSAPKYTAEAARRILRVLDLRPPDGYGRWTGPLIAKALGDVDVQHVWRVLRAQKIDLAARKSWCESNDPEFAAKAAEVVGLYMAPPENAIVISVDEKSSIQALERRQGYLKLPSGRALTGQSHDYKRHGTTTLISLVEIRQAFRLCSRLST